MPADTATLDNATRADQNPATGWTGIVNAVQITSNRFAWTASASAAYYNFLPAAGADCEFFVKIDTVPTDGSTCSVLARMKDVGSAATMDGYGVQISKAAGTDTVQIQSVTNGVATTLGASINQEFSAGDWLKIRIVGSTIYAYRSTDGVNWTELGNRSDSTYTAAGYGALAGGDTTQRLSNFGGGTLNFANPAAFVSSIGTTLSGGVALSMPVSIIAGELLLCFATNDNPGATDMSISGWTLIDNTAAPSTAVKHAIFAKLAAGGDTATLNGAAQDYAATVIRITNHGVKDLTGNIKKGTTATGTSETPDPPNLDAGNSKNWLWLASAGIDDDDNTTTYWPTNYNAIAQAESAQSTSSCMTDTAWRQLAAQSENPGTFAILAASGAEEWAAETLAIPPNSWSLLVKSRPLHVWRKRSA